MMKFQKGDILIRQDGSRIRILNFQHQHNISFYTYEYCNSNIFEDQKYKSYITEIESHYDLDIKTIRKQKLEKLKWKAE